MSSEDSKYSIYGFKNVDGDLVKPIREELKYWDDPHQDRQQEMGFYGYISDWSMCGLSDMVFNGVKVEGKFWWHNQRTGQEIPYMGSLNDSLTLYYRDKVFTPLTKLLT